jgi:hypothetical protein
MFYINPVLEKNQAFCTALQPFLAGGYCWIMDNRGENFTIKFPFSDEIMMKA